MTETETETETKSEEDAPTLVEELSENKLLCDLAPAQLERLIEIGREDQLKRNAKVFCEGDTGDTVYFVLEGAIRISREVPGMGEEALAVLRPGESFGEMALVDDSPRSADAIAHEASRLFAVGMAELESLLFVDRTLACDVLWKMLRMLSNRLRATNDKMTFLSVTSKFE